MILLTATRIDAYGAFIFKVEIAGMVRLVTGDPGLVAATLAEMGISRAEALVRHAQEWGAVEIAREAGSSTAS